MSECIGKSMRKQKRKLFALFVGKTRVAPVCFRVFQIDFNVRDIQIPADDNGFLLLKPGHMFTERVLPYHTVRKPLQRVLRVGRIDIYQKEITVIERYDPAFLVMHLNAEPQRYGFGLVF